MAQPVTLYLIRHGEAAFSPSAAVGETRDRHLTARGQEQIRHAARGLGNARVSAILFSPRARTRETAEILAAALGAPLREDVRLGIGSSAAALDALLADIRSGHADQAVITVSHFDTLSHLRFLIDGREDWLPEEGECLRLDLD